MKRKYDFNGITRELPNELVSYRRLSTIYSGSAALTVKENPWSVNQFNNYRSNLSGKNTDSLPTIWSEQTYASSQAINKKKIKNDDRIDKIKDSIAPFHIEALKPSAQFNTYIKANHYLLEKKLELSKDFTSPTELIKICKNKFKRFLSIFKNSEEATKVENFPLRKSTNIYLAKG
ncbi:MAG: hypothetical protein RL214_981 [Pseudomonadota bacterium]|jgi:hypothetical protein